MQARSTATSTLRWRAWCAGLLRHGTSLHSRASAMWIAALVLTLSPCIAGADIYIDTGNLVLYDNGVDAGGLFRGTPYFSAVEGGIARFYFAGDVSIGVETVT